MGVTQRLLQRVSHLFGKMTKVHIKAELHSLKQSIRRNICELQHQRRQRQSHELRILLVEQGKISVLHVPHVFYNLSLIHI